MAGLRNIKAARIAGIEWRRRREKKRSGKNNEDLIV